MDLEAITIKDEKLCHQYCNCEKLWKCCQIGYKSGDSLSPSAPWVSLLCQVNRLWDTPELAVTPLTTQCRSGWDFWSKGLHVPCFDWDHRRVLEDANWIPFKQVGMYSSHAPSNTGAFGPWDHIQPEQTKTPLKVLVCRHGPQHKQFPLYNFASIGQHWIEIILHSQYWIGQKKGYIFLFPSVQCRVCLVQEGAGWYFLLAKHLSCVLLRWQSCFTKVHRKCKHDPDLQRDLFSCMERMLCFIFPSKPFLV